jgi:hypothetical protein
MTITGICKKAVLCCIASAIAFAVVPPAFAQQQTFESDNEQELRQEAFWSTHRDPTGVVRPDLWREGIDQFLRMKADQLPGLPQTPSQWMQIGPQPLRIDDCNHGGINDCKAYQGTGPDSGEVVDIAIDARGTSDQTVYIATNDGGIWKTTNVGTTWTAMTEFSCTGQPGNQCPSLSMGAVALDPANPNIVYAGTGNPFDGGGLITKGVGIYKSTNGGTTWTVWNPGGIFGDHNHHGVSMNRIVVIPSALVSQPSHLLVATNFGLYLSVDGAINFGSNFPTFNNGLPVLAGNISDLRVDTGVPLLVYAAVNGLGLLSSGDGGITFPVNLFEHQGAPPPGFFSSISFAQSSTNPKRLFVSVAAPTPPTGNTPFLGLYRSDNYGLTWNYMPGANAAGMADGGCQCQYDLTIGLDPQDEDLLYLGFQELWFSINGGLTFGSQAVTRNKVHFDHHAIVFSPPKHRSGKPTRVWVGTDGGISSSQDAGNQWKNLNETIATNLFKHIDIGRGQGDTGFTYGGTQDTGTIEHRPNFNGTDWHLAIDGDGSGVAVDPQDPMSAYGIDVGSYIFTTDGGTTWTIDSNRITPGVWRYAIDPDNPANIFAIDSATAMNGGSFAPGPHLYLSTDSGANFSLLPLPSAAAIRSIRYTNSPEPGSCKKDPKNRNIIWLGLEDGSFVHADCPLDDNPMWVQVDDPTGIGNPVGGIEILPDFQSNGDRVVAVYEGFSNTTNPSNHVWYYDGATWHDISGSLPDLPTHSVYGSVTISNEAGVMTTADLGSTWQVLGTNLATVDSRQLAGEIWPPVLRIGTYGRSTFELNPSNLVIRSRTPNVNGADALLLMTQGLFDDITVETLLSQQRRAGPSQIVDGERIHIERKPLQSLVERIRRKRLCNAAPARQHQLRLTSQGL